MSARNEVHDLHDTILYEQSLHHLRHFNFDTFSTSTHSVLNRIARRNITRFSNWEAIASDAHLSLGDQFRWYLLALENAGKFAL